MSLVFELARPPAPLPANRADVALFVGFVARRAGSPLPAALRAQLAAAGWVDGVWARPAAQVEELLNLPVTLDSWDLFDHLFAWDERPLAPGGDRRRCATYLGAAVRAFFGRGGRRAVVIRVGDPWPFLEGGEQRARHRRLRLRRMLPDFADRGAPEHPFAPHDPASWQGLQHLAGLREVSMVLLPDLADACTYEPLLPDLALPPPVLPEGFVECSPDEPPGPPDDGLRRLPAPRLDSRGYAAWMLALRAATGLLADPRARREAILVAALPLPDLQARRTNPAGGAAHVHAQADLPAYLRRVGVLRDDGNAGLGAASAFVQLGWPWLRTRASGDLPEGLEPPDGVLAGLIAAGASLRGCHRSVAGDFSIARLRDIGDAEPVPSIEPGDDGPTARMARHLCVFAPQPEGWALLSDVTTAPAEAWRFGGASRLVCAVLRAARAAGEAMAFDPNGPALWARLRNGIEDLLLQFWNEGAFAGAGAAQAFSVRCDRSTMTQADLDAGRLIVEISLRPAASIERITVVLNLGNAATAELGLRESA